MTNFHLRGYKYVDAQKVNGLQEAEMWPSFHVKYDVWSFAAGHLNFYKTCCLSLRNNEYSAAGRIQY